MRGYETHSTHQGGFIVHFHKNGQVVDVRRKIYIHKRTGDVLCRYLKQWYKIDVHKHGYHVYM